jgi:hypothetical protein
MSSRTVLSTSCSGPIALATGIFKAGSVRSDPDGSLPRPAKLFDPEPFHTTDYAFGVKKPRRTQIPPTLEATMRALNATPVLRIITLDFAGQSLTCLSTANLCVPVKVLTFMGRLKKGAPTWSTGANLCTQSALDISRAGELGPARLRLADQRAQSPWCHRHRVDLHAEWTQCILDGRT